MLTGLKFKSYYELGCEGMSINVRVTRTLCHVVFPANQNLSEAVLTNQRLGSCSPDRDRKLYLAVFETKGELPDIITVLSLSLWYPE